MKASVYLGNRRVGPRQIDPPRPNTGQVLLKVKRAGICGTDLHIFQGHMDWRVKIPLVMGHEMCGEVVEAPAGADVAVGDRVVVEPTVFCGRCHACRRGFTHVCQHLNFMGVDSPGAFQQYWAVPQDRLHKIPGSLTDEEGALVEPLSVAVHDVRMAGVELGDRSVVLGGGPIGLLVALAARLSGSDVMIAEVNPFRIEKAKAFGFECVNPREQDLKACVEGWTGGAGADLVFEVTGNAAAAGAMADLLRVRGTVALVGVHAQPVPVDLHRFFFRELRLISCRVYETIDFDRAIRIAASGQIDLKSLISQVIPMEEIAAGLEQMDQGGDVMKVLLDVQA